MATRMTGARAARAAARRDQGDRRRATASTPSRSRPSRARRGSRARSSTATSTISAACSRRWSSARSRARARHTAPGRPSTTCSAALTAYLEAVRATRTPGGSCSMPAGGRAAAAARADRGRPRGRHRAARACRWTRDLPDPELTAHCCPPTPTRPPASCSMTTTWSGSSSLRAGPGPPARDPRRLLAAAPPARSPAARLRLRGLAVRDDVHAGRARRAGLRPHGLDAGGRPAGRRRVRPDRACWRWSAARWRTPSTAAS